MYGGQGSRCRARYSMSSPPRVKTIALTQNEEWRYTILSQNIRDKLHVEIDVRTTTAEDTTSVMAKLMGAIEESTSGVTDHRRIHATSVERNAPISSLGKLIARNKSMTRAFKEKAGYMKRGRRARSPKQCRQTTSESTRQLGEPNHLLILEGWSERHQGVCLVTRYTPRFSVGKCLV